MPATEALGFLKWRADVKLYRDKHDAGRWADAQADKRGVQSVCEPFYDEDHRAWVVVAWKTPPKRRR